MPLTYPVITGWKDGDRASQRLFLVVVCVFPASLGEISSSLLSYTVL